LTPVLFAAVLAAGEPGFTISQVSPGVFAAISDPNDARAGGNAGFVIGAESVLDVDAAGSVEGGERLLSEIRSRTKLPIRFSVLTHFHSDHMGGTAVFAKAGATVLAHENVRAWARREWQPDLDADARARYAGLRLPDVTYRDRVTIDLGGRTVDVFHRPGHSGSDALVRVPDAKILFTGDLFSKRSIPGLNYARTDEWIATLDALLRDYPDWTFVPGHGPVAKALDVRFFRDYLVGLRLAVARALKDGRSGAALLETVREQMAVRYKSWTGFEEVDRNIAEVEKELTGTKVYPPAPPR
jgi:cyclase